jgi:flagellar hook-length control protein FliK
MPQQVSKVSASISSSRASSPARSTTKADDGTSFSDMLDNARPKTATPTTPTTDHPASAAASPQKEAKTAKPGEAKKSGKQPGGSTEPVTKTASEAKSSADPNPTPTQEESASEQELVVEQSGVATEVEPKPAGASTVKKGKPVVSPANGQPASVPSTPSKPTKSVQRHSAAPTQVPTISPAQDKGSDAGKDDKPEKPAATPATAGNDAASSLQAAALIVSKPVAAPLRTEAPAEVSGISVHSEKTHLASAADSTTAQDAAAAVALQDGATLGDDLQAVASPTTEVPADATAKGQASADQASATFSGLLAAAQPAGTAASRNPAPPVHSASGAEAPLPAAAPPEAQFAQANHARISMNVAGQLLPNGGSMQIRLDPPELGALQVKVEMRDGTMTASFQTQNDQATRLLSHSLGDLRASLESQGVNVTKLHVEQAPRQQSSSSGEHRQPQDGARPDSSGDREQQRREMLRRMWRKLSGAEDPLDMVA